MRCAPEAVPLPQAERHASPHPAGSLAMTVSIQAIVAKAAELGARGFELGQMLVKAEESGAWKTAHTPTFNRFLQHCGISTRDARRWMQTAKVYRGVLGLSDGELQRMAHAPVGSLVRAAQLLQDFPAVLLAASPSISEAEGARYWAPGERDSCAAEAARVVDAVSALPEAELRVTLSEIKDGWLSKGFPMSAQGIAQLDAEEADLYFSAQEMRQTLGGAGLDEQARTEALRDLLAERVSQRTRKAMTQRVSTLLSQVADLSHEEKILFFEALGRRAA